MIRRFGFWACIVLCVVFRKLFATAASSKKEMLWIELLGVLFLSALTAIKNSSYFLRPSMDQPLPPPFVYFPQRRKYVPIDQTSVSIAYCIYIKQSKKLQLRALQVPGLLSKFRYSVSIVQKCEETIASPLHLSRQIQTFPCSRLISDIHLAPPLIRTKSKKASSLTDNTFALNSFGHIQP